MRDQNISRRHRIALRIAPYARQRRLLLNPARLRDPRPRVPGRPYISDLTYQDDWIAFLIRSPGLEGRGNVLTRLIGRVLTQPMDFDGVCAHFDVRPLVATFDRRHARFVWTPVADHPRVRVRWSEVLVTLGEMRRMAPTPYCPGGSWTPTSDFDNCIQDAVGPACDDRSLRRLLERYPALALSGAYR